jgi:hypothetical protein
LIFAWGKFLKEDKRKEVRIGERKGGQKGSRALYIRKSRIHS